MVAFDTAVVDLTEELGDPVDVLFGIQLGGGTDIDQALGYCQTLVANPAKTVLILITDLYEGGDEDSMLRRAASLLRAGVRLIVLLALSDDGAPGYDHELAAEVAALGAPVFACTPDQFADLLAAALDGRDVNAWAGGRGHRQRCRYAGGVPDVTLYDTRTRSLQPFAPRDPRRWGSTPAGRRSTRACTSATRGRSSSSPSSSASSCTRATA